MLNIPVAHYRITNHSEQESSVACLLRTGHHRTADLRPPSPPLTFALQIYHFPAGSQPISFAHTLPQKSGLRPVEDSNRLASLIGRDIIEAGHELSGPQLV